MDIQRVWKKLEEIDKRLILMENDLSWMKKLPKWFIMLLLAMIGLQIENYVVL